MTLKNNEIYLGDCYELIKLVPNKSVDLIIIDPPYLIEKQKHLGGNNEISQRISQINSELSESDLISGMDFKLLTEFERIMKRIYIYIWCNKNLLFDLIVYYKQKPNILMDVIVWAKTNAMPASNSHFINDCEYCLCVHEKGAGWSKESSFENKKKFYYLPLNQIDKRLYLHPTIKPLEIIKNFIINSSNEGDVILDCFAGSGTTLVASKMLNRQYLGFEINKKFYNIARDRLNGINQIQKKAKIKQLNLFEEEKGD